LDTFFGIFQDEFKNKFGLLVDPWIRNYPILAFGSLLGLGVLIAIVAIYRYRFADLLPEKPSKVD